MVLLIFLLVFIISNIIILKFGQKFLNEFHDVHYTLPNINGRVIIGNSQLEKIRQKVNTKKSKF